MRARALRVLVALLLVGGIAFGAWWKFTPRHVPAGQPPLEHLSAKGLSNFHSQFNDSAQKMRVLVLLSPGDSSCLAAASELQKFLADNPTLPFRVWIDWEPVRLTDFGPPANSVLARVTDARVTQLWDPDRLISSEISRGSTTNVSYVTVWNFLAAYHSKDRWDATAPIPAIHGAPAVEGLHSLDKFLRYAFSRN